MEFLANGYKPAMGSVDIRFDHGSGDRILKLHDVKFVDGQTKVLLMLGIVAFCAELELTAKEIAIIHSCRWSCQASLLSDALTRSLRMSRTTTSIVSDAGSGIHTNLFFAMFACLLWGH